MCFAGALEALGMRSPGEVFWAGHASFVRRPEDHAPYAGAFAAFFGARPDRSWDLSPARPVSVVEDELPDGADTADDVDEETRSRPTRRVRYSHDETLREKDFSTCTTEELDELYRLMSSMRRAGPTVRTRRRVPVPGGSGTPDLRATVRAALRSGGEPGRLHRTGPGTKDRRIVLLVDVSGSMEPYARAFLQFTHAAVIGHRRVEAFTLGTRLTRITRQLSWRDPDAALSRAARTVWDISGGTRLGEGLGSFNERFGAAGMARGAVVVLLSDGWDRGEPAKMAAEMERLRRVSYRVVWVNPLKASPGYAPLARGMAAALPFIDDFLEGHSLSALERVMEVIAGPWN